MKTFTNILFILILLSIIAGGYYCYRYVTLPAMTGPFALLCGLCSAFVWVEILHIGYKKPFNCIKCMAGWLTFIIAWAFHVPFFPFYLIIGLTAGAIFDRVKVRYL